MAYFLYMDLLTPRPRLDVGKSVVVLKALVEKKGREK